MASIGNFLVGNRFHVILRIVSSTLQSIPIESPYSKNNVLSLIAESITVI